VEKWLKKQQKLQIDPLLFYENMLQCLKLCFQLSVKYLAVKNLAAGSLFYRNFWKTPFYSTHVAGWKHCKRV